MEWGDGYYNGDIKTRKTVQSIELNSNGLALKKSEQLRELFESLSSGEVSPLARRPSSLIVEVHLNGRLRKKKGKIKSNVYRSCQAYASSYITAAAVSGFLANLAWESCNCTEISLHRPLRP